MAESLTEAERAALRRLVASEEGQYFDRKSLYEGHPGEKKARQKRKVRDQVVEYVAAFANADGGTLVLGVEDDGSITGCPLLGDEIDKILRSPEARSLSRWTSCRATFSSARRSNVTTRSRRRTRRTIFAPT